MKKILLLMLSIMIASVAYCENIAEMDTLLAASTAKRIEITSGNGDYKIVVWDIDGTGERFVYESKSEMSSKRKHKHSPNVTSSNRVTDLLILGSVTEYESKVDVAYTDGSGVTRNLKLSNKASKGLNRTIGSYRGTERFLDMGVTFARNGKTKWSVISSGIGIGWVTPVSSNVEMDVSMGKSVELTWANVIGVKMSHGRHHLSLGMGLDWRNMVTTGGSYFEKVDGGDIVMSPYEDGVRDRRSRIKIFSLQMPLLYSFDFGKKHRWGVTLGPVVNFNTSASIKTSWREGDREYSVKTRHIGQRPVTVDVMGAVNYGCLGVYARYAPMNMLKDSAGMKFGCFSTGIMLFF